MPRKVLSLTLSFCLVLSSALTVRAGGALEQIDVTGNLPTPIAGHIEGRLVPIRWDARSIPVRYSMNTSLNPIPNPLGPALLSVADAQSVLQSAFDSWNQIPTSYIDMRITNTTGKLTLAGFDFVNELTFRTAAAFTAIASSPSTSLIRDTTLINGTDIDLDGDSDVSNAITTVADVDSDGDIEFPEGFYKAGTILDNDVQFNTKASNGLRFTIADAAADIITRSVDLFSIAVHEFGHSHGLSHTLDNQLGDGDGNGATMYPFIDTGDPAAELAQRSIESDDIAWSSYTYPEGTAASGPAAVQAGDVAFSKVYGLIKGELHHGVFDEPIAGGSAFAARWGSNNIVASGFSGRTRVSVNPANNGLFLIDPAYNIFDGSYVIPAPKGSYAVGIEAVDGQPVPAGSISLTAQIGSLFGQQNFIEEFYNNNKEEGGEVRLGQRKNIPVNPGKTQTGIDVTTSDSFSVSNFGNRNFVGFTNPVAGRYYAVQIPAAQVAALNSGGGLYIQGISFETFLADASVVPRFAGAWLTTGTVDAGGNTTINLANPLEEAPGFIGQDGDFAPFYFHTPHELGRRVLRGIADGSIQNLFLVLQLPTTLPFPGVSAFPPFIGLDGGVPVNDAPIFGFSYVSDDGVTWVRQTNFNFRFSLVLSNPVAP